MYHARVPGASPSVYGRVVDEVPHYTVIPLKIPCRRCSRASRRGLASLRVIARAGRCQGHRLARLPGRRGPVRHVPRRLAVLRAEHSSAGGTPRQQGVDGHEANTGTPRWSWARLLRRVFDLAMATCPLCRRGALRLIAALPQASVITRILRPRKLAAVPPPMAPARARQATCDWIASAHDVARGLVSDVHTIEVCFTPLSV